jgi:hypothetical protein
MIDGLPKIGHIKYQGGVQGVHRGVMQERVSHFQWFLRERGEDTPILGFEFCLSVSLTH